MLMLDTQHQEQHFRTGFIGSPSAFTRYSACVKESSYASKSFVDSEVRMTPSIQPAFEYSGLDLLAAVANQSHKHENQYEHPQLPSNASSIHPVSILPESLNKSRAAETGSRLQVISNGPSAFTRIHSKSISSASASTVELAQLATTIVHTPFPISISGNKSTIYNDPQLLPLKIIAKSSPSIANDQLSTLVPKFDSNPNTSLEVNGNRLPSNNKSRTSVSKRATTASLPAITELPVDFQILSKKFPKIQQALVPASHMNDISTGTTVETHLSENRGTIVLQSAQQAVTSHGTRFKRSRSAMDEFIIQEPINQGTSLTLGAWEDNPYHQFRCIHPFWTYIEEQKRARIRQGVLIRQKRWSKRRKADLTDGLDH